MSTPPPTRTDADVLVVGAGPSGLSAALQLACYGVRVRVVDRKSGPVEQARATIVHARTLELLDRFGLADQAMARGVPVTRVQVHENGRLSAELPLADPGVEGRTRFPCALSLEQSETERLLVAALAEHAVPVEWESTAETLVDTGHGVSATVRRGDQSETITARWVVGADGAGSRVRRELGLSFTGTTYPQTGLLADVALDVDLPPNRLRLNLTRGGFVGILPIGDGRYRLFGAVPPDFVRSAAAGDVSHEAYTDLARDQLQRWFDRYFQVDGRLGEVSWASLFRFHSRIADRLGVGNIFLIGDAAHIHNPAGGQGMNLGIGDAINLAWKLALVVRGEAHNELLDTYQAERHVIAETIIRNTNRGFRLETVSNPVALWMRARLAGRLIGPLSRFPPFRRTAFRMLSQTWIGYRGSLAVAAGGSAAGPLRPGDRAPHAPLASAGGSVLDLTRPNGYHLLVFEGLERVPGIDDPAAIGAGLTKRYLAPMSVHVIPRSEAAAHDAYHASRTRLVLIRPDGYLASVSEPKGPDDIGSLVGHLDRILLRRSGEKSACTTASTKVHRNTKGEK